MLNNVEFNARRFGPHFFGCRQKELGHSFEQFRIIWKRHLF